MNGHVEVVRLELIGHLSELLQGVLPLCLLEPKGLHGLGDFLGDALRAPPVSLGYLRQGRQQAERVVAVVAAVAQQHVLLVVTLVADLTHVLGELKKR